jgi:3-hydroxyisobutyrate dehydrogenase-like beta-hydroxyacid dehydrogenase
MYRVGVIGLGKMGLPIARDAVRGRGGDLLVCPISTEADMPAPVFLAAKAVFDNAAADGWEELDIACVHDQLSGESSPGELA